MKRRKAAMVGYPRGVLETDVTARVALVVGVPPIKVALSEAVISFEPMPLGTRV
jgi:hypothetical protein